MAKRTRTRGCVVAFMLWLAWPDGAQAFTLISNDPQQRGWQASALEVNINVSSCPPELDVPALLSAAAELWNRGAGLPIRISLGENSQTTSETALAGSASDAPLLICDSRFSESSGQDGNFVPGITTVLIDEDSNHLIYGFILLNVQDGTRASIKNLSRTRIMVVIAHELGHLLGLGHSSDPDALMYFEVSNKPVPRLASDDIDGARYVYRPVSSDGDDENEGCGTVFDAQGGSPPNNSKFSTLWSALFLMMAAHLTRRRRKGHASNEPP
ncbi:MAG: matrixin family metalloprotease [Bdellovibrionota bacterium]